MSRIDEDNQELGKGAQGNVTQRISELGSSGLPMSGGALLIRSRRLQQGNSQELLGAFAEST
jgi:hypothetical protein